MLIIPLEKKEKDKSLNENDKETYQQEQAEVC